MIGYVHLSVYITTFEVGLSFISSTTPVLEEGGASTSAMFACKYRERLMNTLGKQQEDLREKRSLSF